MTSIARATAICSNDVAILAWELDEPGHVSNLLGFEIQRELLGDHGKILEKRALASYVPFDGQANPKFEPQNTTVWPIQKFAWRDLTLRQKRDSLERRDGELKVRYSIAAVGRWHAGLTRVATEPSGHTYDGEPVPLGYLTTHKLTNTVVATTSHPPFTTGFTNGILATQYLLHVFGTPDGSGRLTIDGSELEDRLTTTGDDLRVVQSGDVLPLIHEFFAQPGGRFHAALYELEDHELEEVLADNADRLDLILSDAGGDGPWDTRNGAARATLRTLADAPGSTMTMQDRMFNGTNHIGHNKFVVHVADDGTADSVLTGSTNWTWNGLTAQSNNATRCDDPGVAAAFLDYWNRLTEDVLPVPDPLSAQNKGATQSDTLKRSNNKPFLVDLGHGAAAELWFSPNVVAHETAETTDEVAAAAADVGAPRDMGRLFSLMRQAREAIFFLVYYPAADGPDSIVHRAVQLGLDDPSLLVVGAVSDPRAMWSGELTSDDGRTPALTRRGGVSVARATALSDQAIVGQIGDFQMAEKLKFGAAIIHDKIMVIDPLDPERCVVAFGSHNMGYKASRENDENLTIVTGHRGLAEAYAAHVIDVHEHYRFRAFEADAAADPGGGLWSGRLNTSSVWQHRTWRRLSQYLVSREST